MSGRDTGAGERAAPFYCPYCADEDLRPHGDTAGQWRCAACARVFGLRFVGLSPAAAARSSASPDVMSAAGIREAR